MTCRHLAATASGRQPVLLSLAAAFLAALLIALLAAAPAPAKGPTKVIEFAGKRVEAPRAWPVYKLSERPHMCVRMDRRAVYLGKPGANQQCPPGLIGRQRAILVEPGAQPATDTATASASNAPKASASALSGPTGAKASAGAATFTGLGFDACTAPSSRSMAAWEASPFRAVGVYIGGLNRACSQPNLTAAWVNAQVAAGWHLIPTYVGLQAPGSSCRDCAMLTTAQATAQGIAAANDAVTQALLIAMGPGSPIYYDMESYTRTARATAATLAFLEAWTKRLHTLGYLSGVYSSSASGIADLVTKIGTGYVLPDALWMANWNGRADADDPYVPSYAWANQQRIHQYRGGHNETWGGVTLNIDSNYVDGPTVGVNTPIANPDDPVGALDLVGGGTPGHVRVRGWALDPNLPREILAIRVMVGGRAGAAGTVAHELGAIANQPRPEPRQQYPAAGSRHGFDTTFATVKSGRQPVCVYAVNSGAGADALLGCKTVRIPVAVMITKPTVGGAGVRVTLACTWPTGTHCPGNLALRANVSVRVKKRGMPVRTRVVARSLGRRAFRLSGGRSHTFWIPFSSRGRTLLRAHGKLKTQLIVAIPGGRRGVALTAGPRRNR